MSPAGGWTQVKTYELRDDRGRVFAFEVDNTSLGRRGACAVVHAISGARLLREPRWFSWFREEEFCEFDLDGVTYVVWEPWGDNSRYWIGPKPPRWTPQTEIVRDAFARARRQGIRRLFGPALA